MLRPELSRSLLLAPLAALAIALAPAVTSAGEPTGDQKIRISDFDLSKHDDVVRLYRHIRKAAALACGGESRTGSLLPSPNQEACVKQAVDSTVTKIHSGQLTAYHQQETGSQNLVDRGSSGGKNNKSGGTYSDHN